MKITGTASMSCEQCGGSPSTGEACADRFNLLLALDHSRVEPWGSRHGVAFAVFTLQHAAGMGRDMLESCWLLLSRVYQHGDDRAAVAETMRSTYRDRRIAFHSSRNRTLPPERGFSTMPQHENPPKQFTLTIADLADFSAGSYPALLDAWCIATLNAWVNNDG